MMQSVLLRWTPSLNHRSKLKGQFTDVKSGSSISVGPSLCLQKCANNRQLIVAGAQRFLRHACAAHFRVIHTRKTPCALRIYTQTVIGVFFVDGNGNTHACLTG